MRNGTLTVERVEVLTRIRQNLFQAALGDENAGRLGDALNRFQERVLHGGLDQAPLEFVGKASRRQGQFPIERINAGGAIAGVAHAVNLDWTEDGFQATGAEPT